MKLSIELIPTVILSILTTLVTMRLIEWHKKPSKSVWSLAMKTVLWAIMHPKFALAQWLHKRPYSDVYAKGIAVLPILALCLTATAQTATNTAPPPTIIDTVKGYLSSFNPALSNTFSTAKNLDIWTAAEQNLGNNTSADLGVEYTFTRFSSNSIALSGEGVIKAAGVAGSLVAGQAGLGLSYVHVDTKLTFYVDGGYDVLNHHPYCEPGLRVKKALTDNTYGGVGVGFPIEKEKTGRQNIYLFAGFTF